MDLSGGERGGRFGDVSSVTNNGIDNSNLVQDSTVESR